jgi:RNA polymerase sigma-70 factor (ECF subfamily)
MAATTRAGTAAPPAAESSPPAGRTLTAANPATGVHARALLRGEPAGTVIRLQLTGLPPGQVCRLLTLGHDGHREIAGSWRVAYDDGLTVTGTTAIRPAELAALQVVTTSGTRLLTLPTPG